MGSTVETHRAAHDAFNARDWEALKTTLAPNVRMTDQALGTTSKNAEEFVDYLNDWTTAFSNAAVSEPVYSGAGDVTICQFLGTGDNDGPTRMGPPTGKRLHAPFCEVIRWNSEGKAASIELYYDQLTIGQQLGVIPQG